MKREPALWNSVFNHWGHRIRSQNIFQHIAPVLTEGCLDEDELIFAKAIECAPKRELHVHLEAAVPAVFYETLNRSQRLFEENLMPTKRAPFATFEEFIQAWVDNSKLLNSASLFEHLASLFVEDRMNQNIIYSEVHCSPVDFSLMRKRFASMGSPLSFKDCLIAILKGIRLGQQAHPAVDVRLIVDLLWFSSSNEKKQMIDILAQVIPSADNLSPHGGNYIVAVGMGGPETSERSVEIFPLIQECRNMGLAVDIHTGEMTTKEQTAHAIRIIRPDRIAHGITGAPDFFFEGHISMCPLSNLLTGSFKDNLSKHPIVTLIERGHSVSIGSDDPLLFGTTLTLEFVALRRAVGLGLNDFFHLQETAKKAQFAGHDLKSESIPAQKS